MSFVAAAGNPDIAFHKFCLRYAAVHAVLCDE
jgi:hypothetical protein